MRAFPAFFAALLLVAISLGAIGSPGTAVAACCVTYTPVHVYVPPPTHVYVPTHTYVPHTTYIRPGTAHTSNRSLSTQAATRAKPKPVPPTVVTVVNNQPTPARTRCTDKRTRGEGCKKQKDDEQTAWSTIRRWLQIGKQ